MARRGLNIYHRKDGRWEGRYKIGYKDNGQIRYRSVYGKSFSMVKSMLEEKYSEAAPAKVVCTSLFCEIIRLWSNDIAHKVKESTYANYVMKIEKHVIPFLGKVKYDMLTVQKINEFIDVKLSDGLSAKYVSDMVILIKSIAKFANKNYGYVNRIENVSLPKLQVKTEKKTLSDNEQKVLRNALFMDNSLSNTGILLASLTGLRVGELCALKWSDIDFEKNILTVRGTVQRIRCKDSKNRTKLIETTPKSKSSVRVIPLPECIIDVLKKHVKNGDTYILSGTDKPIEPRTMQYRFKKFLERHKLPCVTFHYLRHMFATDCLAMGFDVKTLSEILGHSSATVTLNRYVHSSLERKQICMKMFSDNITSLQF